MVNRLLNNFKLRNIEVSYFDTIQDATNNILKLIPTKCTVGIGHSSTLQKMNIAKLLLERGNVVFDKELATSKEECKILKKKALLTDWYISGTNAVSEDGVDLQ